MGPKDYRWFIYLFFLGGAFQPQPAVRCIRMAGNRRRRRGYPPPPLDLDFIVGKNEEMKKKSATGKNHLGYFWDKNFGFETPPPSSLLIHPWCRGWSWVLDGSEGRGGGSRAQGWEVGRWLHLTAQPPTKTNAGIVYALRVHHHKLPIQCTSDCPCTGPNNAHGPHTPSLAQSRGMTAHDGRAVMRAEGAQTAHGRIAGRRGRAAGIPPPPRPLP